MPTKETQAFLDTVAQQIGWSAARGGITNELADHIQTHAEELTAQGCDAQQAERQAILAMGNAKEIGQALDKLHKPQLSIGILVMTIGLTVAAVLNLYYCTLQGLGTLKGTLSGMALGIVIAVVIYFMDYSRWLRWSLWIYGLGCVLWGVTEVFGVTVAGSKVFLHFLNSTVSMTPLIALLWTIALAGCICLWQDKGLKGLLGAGALAACSVVLMVGQKIVFALLLALVYWLMLSLSIHWGGFGGKRGRNHAVVSGSVLLGIIAGVAWIGNQPYYLARIRALFQPIAEGNGPGWSASQADITWQNAQWFGASYLHSDGATTILTEPTTNYMLMKIIGDFGIAAGLVVVMALGGLLVYGWGKMMKVHTQYGRLLGIGALAWLGSQCVLHVLMNMSRIGTISVSLPFFSMGGNNMLISWVLMGMVLSIWRRNNILNDAMHPPIFKTGGTSQKTFITWENGKLTADFTAFNAFAGKTPLEESKKI